MTTWEPSLQDDPTTEGFHLLEEEPPGKRYLVAYTSRHPRLRRITEAVAEHVRRVGHVAELGEVTRRRCCLHLPDYDAAIVTVSVGLHLDRAVVRWLGAAHPTLEETPTALFIVGRRWGIQAALRHARRIGWRPALIATFPDDANRHGLPWGAHSPRDHDDAARAAAQFVAIVDGVHASRERELAALTHRGLA